MAEPGLDGLDALAVPDEQRGVAISRSASSVYVVGVLWADRNPPPMLHNWLAPH